MGIIQTGDHGSPLQIKDGRAWPTKSHDFVGGARRNDLAVLDSDCFDEGRDSVRGNLRVIKDQVGRHVNLLSPTQE